MKISQILFALLFAIDSFGQLNECSLFSITEISSDLIPNQLNVSIYCDTTTEYFVTYPYIQTVVNCESDVFASGEPYWFGQSGAHTQVYTITTNDIVLCSPMIALFYYQTMEGSQLCTLTYDWDLLNLENEIEETVNVYPNPFHSELKFVSEDIHLGKEFIIYNNLGQTIYIGKIFTEKTAIDLSNFSDGIYYLNIDNQTIKIVKKYN